MNRVQFNVPVVGCYKVKKMAGQQDDFSIAHLPKKRRRQDMKKLWRISFIYLIAGFVCGVFYREYTKYMHFNGRTALAFAHVHLLVLGALLFLILMLFSKGTKLTENRKFKTFLVLYNIGLPLMVIMLMVRGITQVLASPLSKGADSAISGIAGLSHVIIAVALIVLFLALRPVTEEPEPEKQ